MRLSKALENSGALELQRHRRSLKRRRAAGLAVLVVLLAFWLALFAYVAAGWGTV